MSPLSINCVGRRREESNPPLKQIFGLWYYTPKHGSWLNLAESELAVLSGQCLNRRIPDAAKLTSEAAAWVSRRNTHNAKANWHFTSADARVKLKSLYPAL